MSMNEKLGSAVAELVDREPAEAASIGGTIDFWISGEGQELIESFGSWKGSTSLSCWLAQAYPRFYGSDARLNNLWGRDNSSVAAFAQTLEVIHGADSPECQTLAAALNFFARDPSLHI